MRIRNLLNEDAESIFPVKKRRSKNRWKKVRYMISDAANLLHMESHVLRYWEEELDLKIPRNEMGHRYYTKENLQQFEQIRSLKEQAIS